MLDETDSCISYPFLVPIANKILPNFGDILPYLAKFRIKKIGGEWCLNFNYLDKDEVRNNKRLLQLESLTTNPDFLLEISKLDHPLAHHFENLPYLAIKSKNSSCCGHLCGSCTKVTMPFYYHINFEGETQTRVRINQRHLEFLADLLEFEQ